jgi:hypothetical protein
MGNLCILTEIITMIHYMETDLLKILYDNVSTRPEYKEVVWPFINELLSIIFLGYQRALFHDTTDTMIHERIEFEETLKCKGFYKNIEANYKGELSGFIDKKEYYLKQINDVSAQLENNKGLLFSLDNDLYARRKNDKRTGNYDSELKEIQDTTLQYHDVENENLRLSKKLLVLQKEVSRIDNQISQVNLSYTRQQDEIKKMQMTNAQSYFELEKSLERHISSSIADMNVKLREQDIDSNEFQNSISIVKDKNEAFLKLSLDFIEGVYQIMYRFSSNEQDAIIKSAEILEAGYKTDRGMLVGPKKEFVMAPQIDNLECSYGLLKSLLQATPAAGTINLMCLFDNEEIGSGTRQGAASMVLADLLERITLSLGLSKEEYKRSLASSFIISAYNAQGYHPSYAGKYDPTNACYMYEGIVIKNAARGSYTPDALSAAVFIRLCGRSGARFQLNTNRSDVPGGSTLGAISQSKVSIPSVDIGLAQIAMHSAYETGGAKDLEDLVKAITEFYQTHIHIPSDGTIEF